MITNRGLLPNVPNKHLQRIKKKAYSIHTSQYFISAVPVLVRGWKSCWDLYGPLPTCYVVATENFSPLELENLLSGNKIFRVYSCTKKKQNHQNKTTSDCGLAYGNDTSWEAVGDPVIIPRKFVLLCREVIATIPFGCTRFSTSSTLTTPNDFCVVPHASLIPHHDSFVPEPPSLECVSSDLTDCC
ncbi:hypothetical protein CDAR_550991 [Caerostris darwini]|uniref:Uncharacterized protein n=1 Tax=Caerostris darwini TaxID=1538125 RepID=A0AAV4QMF6_9ARAC|nr:hypothetical protein CDAR_550991 [Caerostris darwini]